MANPNFKKAVIRVVNGEMAGDSFEVLYNPEEYTVTKSNQFQDVNIIGLQTPIQKFVSGNADTLTMDLRVDTYTRPVAESEDVREITGKIAKLLEIDSELHAPPVCEFSWGGADPVSGASGFKAIIESLTQKFTFFLDDGRPVRASLNVKFKEYKSLHEQLSIINRQSADRTHRRVFKTGDSLWQYAAEEYGDPERWRNVALANEIENPRIIAPGTELIIPALE